MFGALLLGLLGRGIIKNWGERSGPIGKAQEPAEAPPPPVEPAPAERPVPLKEATGIQNNQFDSLRMLYPNAKPEVFDALSRNSDYLKSMGISTPKRMQHFMAQLAHESDGFKALEEYASGKNYEGRRDLGNTNPGDGERYKGRGLIQLTGRANYEAMSKKIGVDLVNHPEYASNPENAIKIAAQYWADRKLNQFADKNDIKSITKAINGGTNGLDNRAANYRLLNKSFDFMDFWKDYRQSDNVKTDGISIDFESKIPQLFDAMRSKGWEPVIASGMRTQEEQAEKVKLGYSKTMKSKHLTGDALDIVDKRYGWDGPASDVKFKFWQDLGSEAQKLGFEWGGGWQSFKDVAHVQRKL